MSGIEIDERAEQMLHEERAKADRVLGGLMLGLFPVALGLAAVHGAWIVAFLAGGLLSGATYFVIRTRPGTLTSRLTVAGALMGYAALVIQETHGMTEMHFAFFAGLAFLTVYRDWRTPVFAGLVAAVHHALFHLLQLAGAGFWVFPMAMHGLKGWGMVALHGSFVVFEVAILIYVARSLEADTRSQARMLIAQERSQSALLALAEQLEAKDLNVDEIGTGEVGAALGSLRHGIGHVAELVRSIARTATTVASASDQMVATTTEAGRANSEVAGSLQRTRRRRAAPGRRDQLRPVAGRGGHRGRALQRRERRAGGRGDAAGSVRRPRGSRSGRRGDRRSAGRHERLDRHTVGDRRVRRQVRADRPDRRHDHRDRGPDQPARAQRGDRGRTRRRVGARLRRRRGGGPQARRGVAGGGSHDLADRPGDTDRDPPRGELVEEGAERSTTSASTAQETRHAFERITTAVDEMSEQSAQISEATERIADGARRMREDMDRIASVAEQSSSATQHASAATQQTSASSQQVAASAEVLRESARELQSLVDTFRVDGAGQPEADAVPFG